MTQSHGSMTFTNGAVDSRVTKELTESGTFEHRMMLNETKRPAPLKSWTFFCIIRRIYIEFQ